MDLRIHSIRAKYWLTVGASHLPFSKSYFVLGHSRSGTNWLADLLSQYFGIPLYLPYDVRLPTLRPVILNMHRFAVVPARTVYIQRDGRDVMTSYYYEVLNTFPRGTRSFQALERMCKAELVRENARENLPAFIDWIFSVNKAAAPPWDYHVREARRRGLFVIRYEDLLSDGEATTTAAVNHLTRGGADPERIRAAVEAQSFARRYSRKQGQEDKTSHGRKGVAGDWRNLFSPEAARRFDHYAGEALVECGYEPDRSWVGKLAATAS